MSFIDKVKVNVIAGDGGNGKMSFRREKFVDKGGPDGGDAGKGGDVILVASRNQNTLVAFRYQKEIKAEDGHGGDKQNKHGKNAKNTLVAVPVGTVATNEDGEIVADLVRDGQEVTVAKGGLGGFGNAHFVSSRRQAPKFAEKGEPGEEFELQLELKMIADVGLVGLPNAGKSTLLSRVSNARPEIANYAFTTLRPNLGVVDVDKKSSLLMADIPGLIEGAADGKGLGHDFLRHVERTAVILHLVDAYNDDVAKVYTTVKEELRAYQPELAERPEIICITKIEGLDDEITDDLMAQIQAVAPEDAQIMAISAQSGAGLQQMLYVLNDRVVAARKASVVELTEEEQLPVLKITDTSDAYQITEVDRVFIVTGERIERFARRTDFDNEQGVQRLRDIMRRAGILHQLVRKGIEADELIQIGNHADRSFPY